jgi:DNA-directed RNA polymerase sigma subunit (sigma70/sigma32)
MSNTKNSLPAARKSASASLAPTLGGEDGLNAYLAEIKKFPLLAPEQEYMLAKRFQEHQDPEAARQLVTSHLRLVAKIAMGYRGYGLPVSELISEGNIGLMQGVKKFEPDRQDGHHGGAEEAVLQPAPDEKEPRCIRGFRSASR